MANPEHMKVVARGADAIRQFRQDSPGATLDLRGANLRRAELRRADLSGADLTGADLTRADLIESDLGGARLDEAKLRRADLSRCELHDARCHLADLSKTDLRRANLARAKLTGCDLSAADLSHADLAGADLTEALLLNTNLYGAELDGAIFRRAHFGETAIVGVDLASARDLSAVTHDGPSSLGLDTILRSGPSLPDAFVRGCGYDPRIQTMLSGTIAERTDVLNELATEDGPLRLQSCFISYSTKDRPFVDRLQHALNAAGVDYWYAPEHGRWGEKITDQIDREISVRDRVILVCSASSLQDSDWVQWEIERAGEKVFPVMLDDALTEWNHPRATRLREILAGDFRGALEGEPFEKAVSRLVAGLRRNDGRTA